MKTLTLTFTLLAATLAGAQGKYQTFGLGPDTGFNGMVQLRHRHQ